jgi:hypothetical protein
MTEPTAETDVALEQPRTAGAEMTPHEPTSATAQGSASVNATGRTRPTIPPEAGSLLRKIEKLLDGRTVIAYFTSFRYFAPIDDDDADIIERILLEADPKQGVCLVISSPGGLPLAAERIIHICRHYSRCNFDVLVPRSAKSAATMIALGANRLLMGPTAELGPIDLQVARLIQGQRVPSPIDALIDSYERLLKDAIDVPAGKNVAVLYRMLDRFFDPIDIERLRQLRRLSRDIARTALMRGMLAHCADKPEVIDTCVELFADWTRNLTHARAIFPDAICAKGVQIETPSDDLDRLAFRLYEVLDRFVSTEASKVVMSTRTAACTPAPEVVAVHSQEITGGVLSLVDVL